MDLALATVMDWLAQHMWPLTRVSSMLLSMAVLSGTTITPRIKVLLAIAIIFAVSPALPAVTVEYDPISPESMLITAQQILIGVALGFASLMVLQTFVLAGQAIAMQIGLGFASMVDPTNGQTVPVLSQFFLMLATLLFLAVDGHLLMFRFVMESFTAIPIGTSGLSTDAMWRIVNWGSIMYAAALTTMLSAIIALLLVNFSFGVMTRASPQLNIFSIGFPITMVGGLIILWLTIGGFITHFELQWERGVTLMCEIIERQC